MKLKKRYVFVAFLTLFVQAQSQAKSFTCEDVTSDARAYFTEGRWMNLTGHQVKAYGSEKEPVFKMTITKPVKYITVQLQVVFSDRDSESHFFHLSRNYSERLKEYRLFGRLIYQDEKWQVLVERMWRPSEVISYEEEGREVLYLNE